MSLYQQHHKINNFTTLSQKDKQEIIDLLKQPKIIKDYYYESAICTIIKFLDTQDIIEIANLYLKNYIHDYRFDPSIIMKAYEIDQSIKKEVLKVNRDASLSLLLLMNPTINEEVIGLRSLKNRFVFKDQYTPTKEALNKLPPVMRLNKLEILLQLHQSSSKILAYNIFKNLSRDDIETMLFPNVIKYQERVSHILDKFDELVDMGKDASITVSGFCNNCKEFNIIFNTKVIRTKTGFAGSRVGQMLIRSEVCPFCWNHLDKPVELIIVS